MADITEVDAILYGDANRFLSRLYDFFKPLQVDSLKASFIARVLTTLLTGNSKETLDYLKSRDDILEILIQHPNALSEYFIKLILLEDGYSEVSTQYLIEKNFSSLLINKLSPELKSNHTDYSQFIIDILQVAGSESPIFDQFIHNENLELLFSLIMDENNCSGFIQGLNIINFLVYLVSGLKLSTEDSPSLITRIVDSLDKFKAILLKEATEVITLTSGPLRPLGFNKIKIIELINALLQLNYDDVVVAIKEHDILSVVIDMFFKYEQNSILHKTIDSIICRIIAKPYEALINELFVNLKLHERLVLYIGSMADNKEPRSSCIAYSYSIAYGFVQKTKTNEYFMEILNQSSQWTTFAQDILIPKMEAENKPLGGLRPHKQDISLSYDDQDDDVGVGMNDEYSDSSNSDDSEEDSEDELGGSDESDDDLEYDDDIDLSSDNDHKDYDVSKAEVSSISHVVI